MGRNLPQQSVIPWRSCWLVATYVKAEVIVDPHLLVLIQDLLCQIARELDPHHRFEIGTALEAPLACDTMLCGAVVCLEAFHRIRVLCRPPWRAAQPRGECPVP